MYRLGFHVIMGCRNEARGNAARAAILEEAGTANEDRLHLILVDVASLKSVDVFCKQVKARSAQLHLS